jgi:hypothetical protein
MRSSATLRVLRTNHRMFVALAFVLAAAWPRPAAAQDRRPAPQAEFAAGALFFPDDGVVTEGFAGGAARFYVLPRISVGPEIAWVWAENHSHLMLTGNMTFDFARPVNGEPAQVTPFVVVGGGLYQTREEFFDGTYTSSEGAFTAGGGVRALLGSRVIAGVEARVGWELHVRVNGTIGVRLGP